MPLQFRRCCFAYLGRYVFEGDGYLLRAALGILAKLEHKLYGETSEEVLKVLGWPKEVTKNEYIHESMGDEDSFMEAIRNILKA